MKKNMSTLFNVKREFLSTPGLYLKQIPSGKQVGAPNHSNHSLRTRDFCRFFVRNCGLHLQHILLKNKYKK